MGTNYYLRPKGFKKIEKINRNLYSSIHALKEEYLKQITDILISYKDEYEYYADLLYLSDISDLEDKVQFSVYGLEVPDIHICKLSGGWTPLFESNRLYSNFNEFEDFYNKYKDKLNLFDEYDDIISFEDFKNEIFSRLNNKNYQTHLQYNNCYGIYYYKDELGVEWTNSHFS